MHFTQQPHTPQLSSSGPVLVRFLCIQVTIQAGRGDIYHSISSQLFGVSSCTL